MGAHYSEAVRVRCREPRRAGSWPEGAAGVGTGDRGSLAAGAWTQVQVHVRPGSDVIDDARFRVFGCSAALASASYAADALVGTTTRDVRHLSAAAIADALELPDDKRAMAALAAEAAVAAAEDVERRLGAGDWGLGAGAGLAAASRPDPEATR
jgi:nitrogen fixation NifU-like protein